MTESELQKYASLIIHKGVNLLDGQCVVIYSSIEASPLFSLLEKEAYKSGAKKVIKLLSDEEQIRYQLHHLNEIKKEKYEVDSDDSFVRIRIRSEGLNYLSGVDSDQLKKYNEIQRELHKDINQKVHQWTIVAYPGLSWAKDIFPDLSDESAVDSLWRLIKQAVRLDGDPIDNWNNHDKHLHERCDYLNSVGIQTLYFKSANGTDFKISLTKKSIFIGGSVVDTNGVSFEPNMPSEEVYTVPDSLSAEGVVFATKPLFIYGQVFENFGFRFVNGKVVEIYGDERTKAFFTHLFDTIDGSNQLGEVALVPFNSPISKIETLFYKNLFDENAACHLALGDYIIDALDFHKIRSKEEFDSLNLNHSEVHIDFMIGTDDMEIIVETASHEFLPLFINGDWHTLK